MSRVGNDPDEEVHEPEVGDGLAGECDMPVVGRVERTAEDPDLAAHFQIMTSSPTSTSEPGFTPAARSASSSSSPSGAVPTTRNPWPVRNTLKRPARAAWVGTRETRATLRPRARLRTTWRTEREQEVLQLVDARTRCTRDAVDGHDALVLDGERRRLGVEVGLVEHDELGPFAEPRAVGGELAVDDAVALVRVSLGGIDDVEQQSRALEMRQELVTEPDPLARAGDQPRHVGDRELTAVGAVDRAEHRLQRRERVVRDLRFRVRYRRRNDDLPAFGSPISPRPPAAGAAAPARTPPRRPVSANRGVWRVVSRSELPRPPRPPWATTHLILA